MSCLENLDLTEAGLSCHLQHQNMQTLAESLKPCESLLLNGVHAALMKQSLQQLLETVNTVVADGWEPGQAVNDIQMCYCIKPDINKFLDAARDRFNRLTEDLQGQVGGCCLCRLLPVHRVEPTRMKFGLQTGTVLAEGVV